MSTFAEEHKLGSDTLRYGFAVGRVRVLETRSLDAAAFERLLDAPSFSEQKRLLSETIYGRYIERAFTAEEVERALDEALADFYRLLDDSALPREVHRFFRVRYDFANLKAAAKSRALGAPLEGLLVAHGTLPLEAFHHDLHALPKPFSTVAAQLDHPDTRIDLTVDRAMYAELTRLSRESGSEFLQMLGQLFVDIANLKSLVRSKLAGMAPDRAEDLFFEGGTVSVARLGRMALLPTDELTAAIMHTPGFKRLDPERLLDTAHLDLSADDMLIGAIRHARRGPINSEPVIAYVLSREFEVATLRVVLLGKLGGIETDTMRARLRARYR